MAIMTCKPRHDLNRYRHDNPRVASQTPAHLRLKVHRGRYCCIVVASPVVCSPKNPASFSPSTMSTFRWVTTQPPLSLSCRALSTTIRAGRFVSLFMLQPMSEAGMQAEADYSLSTYPAWSGKLVLYVNAIGQTSRHLLHLVAQAETSHRLQKLTWSYYYCWGQRERTALSIDFYSVGLGNLSYKSVR